MTAGPVVDLKGAGTCCCCLQEADLGQLEERIRAKLTGETPKCV